MVPFLELKGEQDRIGSEVRAAVERVLSSGWYVLGKELEAFEEEFAEYLGVAHVVGVGSGTDAIHLALRALGVGPGDEVITAANTCVPTLAGISATGAAPVLVDVDEETLTLDPSRLTDAVGERTKAVVPVHLYGHPCDMDGIAEALAGRDIAVMEDCAQAHGARYRGRLCGGLGSAAAFSFYPTKNLGAYGDGGAVATDDAGVAEELRRLRNYGEVERYRHAGRGFNSRLDEVQAAVLRVKLGYLEEWNEARRVLAQLYGEALKELPVRLPAEAQWARHCRHLYVIRSSRRDALQAHLGESGIGTLLHYPVPIHLQEAYAFLGKGRGAYPQAERACDEVISLPLYPWLPLEAVAEVAGAIAGFAR